MPNSVVERATNIPSPATTDKTPALSPELKQGVRIATDTFDHDIRNPLTAASLRLQLGIRRGGLSAEEASRVLQTVLDAVDALEQVARVVNKDDYKLTERGPHTVIDIGIRPHEGFGRQQP